MEWVPQALVIGPQGVLDVVNMTGRLIKAFAGLKQVGARVHLQWVIYFPWVPDAGKFKGEVDLSATWKTACRLARTSSRGDADGSTARSSVARAALQNLRGILTLVVLNGHAPNQRTTAAA